MKPFRQWPISLRIALVVCGILLIFGIFNSRGGGGGSGRSASGCTTWVASQDGAVVASEYNTIGCDGGTLMSPVGDLNPVPNNPAHANLVCNIPFHGGGEWTVYVGVGGDPNRETSDVCNMLNQDAQNSQNAG